MGAKMDAYLQMLFDQMTEQLDDLLVESNLEPRRQSRLVFPKTGMGMVISIKEPPRVSIKLDVFPNETEEPHFKVTYQNCSCRFKISDCSVMKAEATRGVPPQIKKIMKEIKKVWQDNNKAIIDAWNATRPTDQNHGHQKVR